MLPQLAPLTQASTGCATLVPPRANNLLGGQADAPLVAQQVNTLPLRTLAVQAPVQAQRTAEHTAVLTQQPATASARYEPYQAPASQPTHYQPLSGQFGQMRAGPAEPILPSAPSSPSLTTDTSGTDETGSFDRLRHVGERNDTSYREYDQIMLDRRILLERHEAGMAELTRRFQLLVARMEQAGRYHYTR